MMFWRIFRLELRVAFRHSAEIANPLWFFLIVITLFPLSIGPEPQLLARIAPGIIWVAALLSSLPPNTSNQFVVVPRRTSSIFSDRRQRMVYFSFASVIAVKGTIIFFEHESTVFPQIPNR